MKRSLFFLIFVFSALSVQSQELEVFALNSIFRDDGEKVGFVSLTDDHSFRWSDHPDSAIIANSFLKRNINNSRNYHQFDSDNRALFLEMAEIKETDKVFIYNLKLDTTMIFHMDELSVSTQLGPFIDEPPYRQIDYVVGLEIEGMPLSELGNYHENSFVAICEENPFSEGNAQPLVWEATDSSYFPVDQLNPENSALLHKFQTEDCYVSENEDHVFHLRNLQAKNTLHRLLVILDSKSDSIVFEKAFYEGESATIKPLTNINESYSGSIYQWTGKVFKNKPPIVYGFLGQIYDCPKIHFIVRSQKPIRIHCDNRL